MNKQTETSMGNLHRYEYDIELSITVNADTYKNADTVLQEKLRVIPYKTRVRNIHRRVV